MKADRCNRADNSKKFGDKAYGREELVAELTAAMCGHELGFNTAVEKNNAAYLSSWLKVIKQEPNFLVSVLADVNKAAKFIDDAMAKVKIA
jgi:antirestriction protein ArdC